MQMAWLTARLFAVCNFRREYSNLEENQRAARLSERGSLFLCVMMRNLFKYE